MNQIPESWLEAFNARMREEEVPHSARPFQAVLEWSRLNHSEVMDGSKEERAVFDWFSEHSPAEAQFFRPMFSSVLYFDAHFWSFHIPRMYGIELEIDIADSLVDMPSRIKQLALSQMQTRLEYRALWVDCCDYAYGLEDHRRNDIPREGDAFLFSADQQLQAVIKLLGSHQPQAKAMESARMAVEMFSKAFACFHCNLDEMKAKKFSHDIAKLLNHIHSVSPEAEVLLLAGKLGLFPDVGSRYSAQEFSGAQLWQGYKLAQFAGTAVVRSVSSRDTRAAFSSSS